ncbi:hypothetical protein Q0Z83_034670 [Actinoplanes sichuanensis]|uniref:Uncharacterized protein n=1 Tax=Actinoplanes sichuanensis TaxID=512349 RepID=A0ABW4AWF9_9ACTN|nr:hypothetical protein [Actinoplanes sichuanensis]BEL05276.1 hypothetical protein Q0Z83_034670 [Actinoplanes sichuanensis]
MSPRPRMMDAPEGIIAAVGAALGSGVVGEAATPAGFTHAVASIRACAGWPASRLAR